MGQPGCQNVKMKENFDMTRLWKPLSTANCQQLLYRFKKSVTFATKILSLYIKRGNKYKRKYTTAMINKRILSLLLLTFFAVIAFAQKEYYTNIDGVKGGADLKNALYNLIKNHKKINYGSGESKTWGAFYTTDAVVENGKRRVLDMYSNEKRYFGSKGSAVSGMNIEHSVPKSWWGGTQNNAYCDLHHLNPSDQNANSRKSNYPLGEITNPSWDNGVTFVGKANIDGSSQNAFEPCDEYKGDFARTYMYMFTCYQDFTWKTTQMNYANSTYPTLKPWAVKLLLKWHKQDPVSEKEVNRNNAVYAVQGNRNPFVDYPQLADYVWGDSINYVFHLTGEVEDGNGGNGSNPGGDDNTGDDDNTGNDNTGGDDNTGDDNAGDDNSGGNDGNFASGSFTLVKDAEQLTVGDSIIIAYENFVMGAHSDNGNYRTKTSATINNGVITSCADDTQIVVLAQGAKAGTYALNVGNGYLAAVSSSSNYVKTVSTVDDNASWTISINSDALATVKAQGSYSRNILQYNTSSPRFSCYNGNQKPVNIYAKSSVSTNIVETVSDNAVVAVYSITGVCVRRAVGYKNAVSGLAKGIYIVNGKKLLVK